ncbi:NAD-dependent epimerase/dehydratase family protein [Pseudonocardia humida]|uniref:NAD(P)-dependent oxidoreductase n=1 Tax=Pseudonocardia humida TaxID=2800819 RepID=A0ABT1ABL5_9PSEU|nr:NAD(P)-dependent oxidoreductase [Pseudonocardia humida]MCO1660383.1 NAD(P)-dependent oxidoreductase [Pseudonocardia humida]
MRLAVTGATGFVGGAVCRAVEREGWSVLALGRRGGADVRWDITDGPLPDPPRVDAVVHCAGSVSDTADRRAQWRANVEGTANVLASFPGARFVHVSTASVYDPRRPTVLATEDLAPVARYPDAYGASKAAAERLVRDRRPDAVVLRPHAVYGPGDTTLLPRVLGAVRRGALVAVGDGTQRVSLTSVANLVRACLLAARGDARGVFNVTDDAPVLLADALAAVLAERGVAARVRFVPLALAWPLACAAEVAHRWRGPADAGPPRLTRYAVTHLARERTLDITAARTVLGYRPTPTSFAGAASW